MDGFDETTVEIGSTENKHLYRWSCPQLFEVLFQKEWKDREVSTYTEEIRCNQEDSDDLGPSELADFVYAPTDWWINPGLLT